MGTTISVGYGEGDAVDNAEQIESDGRYNVRVGDRTGALQIDTPGKIRIYAAGFWKYVDVDDASATGDTGVRVSAE